MKDPISPKLRALLAFSLVLALLPLLLLTEANLKTRSLRGRSVSGERYYLPPSRVIRGLSFGFNELAADLLWVRTISYFTTHFASDRDLSHMDRYVHTVIALDPYFRSAYRYGSSMLTFTPRSNKPILRAIELLKKGQARFPEEHKLPLKIGFLYANELRTKNAKQKRLWRLEGARWIRRAILLGADQPWLPSLAASLYSKEGELQMAIHHLQEAYLVAKDPETRRQIASRLMQMHARGIAVRLEATRKQLEAAYKSSRIPYVSRDLFLLIAPPADAPPDRG